MKSAKRGWVHVAAVLVFFCGWLAPSEPDKLFLFVLFVLLLIWAYILSLSQSSPTSASVLARLFKAITAPVNAFNRIPGLRSAVTESDLDEEDSPLPEDVYFWLLATYAFGAGYLILNWPVRFTAAALAAYFICRVTLAEHRMSLAESRFEDMKGALVDQLSNGAQQTSGQESPVRVQPFLYYIARRAHERKDYGSALSEWRRLAEHGDARSKTAVGIMYENGHGVSKDYTEALRWYSLAAAQGDDYAQLSLGLMYQDGRGVPQDLPEAAKWMRLAADQGHAEAQRNLGFYYCFGSGMQRDFQEAAKWFRQAAEQGNADAILELGCMYASGVGVPKDITEAIRLLVLASEQSGGHQSFAQYNLGLVYASEGVTQDYVQAYLWLSAAVAFGGASGKAASAIDEIERKMTPDQMAEAQRLARERGRIWGPFHADRIGGMSLVRR